MPKEATLGILDLERDGPDLRLGGTVDFLETGGAGRTAFESGVSERRGKGSITASCRLSLPVVEAQARVQGDEHPGVSLLKAWRSSSEAPYEKWRRSREGRGEEKEGKTPNREGKNRGQAQQGQGAVSGSAEPAGLAQPPTPKVLRQTGLGMSASLADSVAPVKGKVGRDSTRRKVVRTWRSDLSSSAGEPARGRSAEPIPHLARVALASALDTPGLVQQQYQA